MKKILTLLPLICCSLYVLGQGLGTISGSVTDKNLLTAIPGATVSLEGTPLSAITDTLGRFRITGVPPKTYTLKISVVGYTTAVFYNLVLTSGNETNLSVQMEAKSQTLEEVLVKNRKTAVAASLETPLSVQKLTAEEIRSNPGGNFDISRVIQALPGVGGTSGSVGGYRNDIIIRGGAPNENVYYLDGIEIPTINHFATQGSGGGPTGILNVSFI
jgi:hypothetical protein